MAIVVGVCVLIWLPDSPVHAHFLTKEERIAALERVRDDSGGTENKHLKRNQVTEAVTDIRTWLIVLTTLLSKLYLSDYNLYLLSCPKASIPNGGLSNCGCQIGLISNIS